MNDTTTTTKGSAESNIKLFGHTTSLRGAIAVLVVTTLCYCVIVKPDIFGEDFKDTVVAIVFFYFGQKTNGTKTP